MVSHNVGDAAKNFRRCLFCPSGILWGTLCHGFLSLLFPVVSLSVVGVGPYGRIAGKCRDVVVSELVFTIGILFNGEAAEHVGIALSIGMDALQRQVDVYDFVDVPCHVIRQL